MASIRPRSVQVARALIGAAALYALVLSGFLAGLSPLGAMPSGTDIVCGRESSPGKAPSPAADHGCCLLACATAFAGPLALPAEGRAIRPDRRVAAVAWRRLGGSVPAAPIPIALNARGPPLA